MIRMYIFQISDTTWWYEPYNSPLQPSRPSTYKGPCLPEPICASGSALLLCHKSKRYLGMCRCTVVSFLQSCYTIHWWHRALRTPVSFILLYIAAKFTLNSAPPLYSLIDTLHYKCKLLPNSLLCTLDKTLRAMCVQGTGGYSSTRRRRVGSVRDAGISTAVWVVRAYIGVR